MSHKGNGRCNHRKYGLSCQDFDSLYERSKGHCELCRDPRDRPLVIDHDHAYGWRAVRGLLCYRCNHMVWQAEGRPSRYISPEVRRYLKKSWYIKQPWFRFYQQRDQEAA